MAETRARAATVHGAEASPCGGIMGVLLLAGVAEMTVTTQAKTGFRLPDTSPVYP